MRKKQILDENDIKIIKELDNNARNSFRHIAKKIHKSKEFVRYRINNLNKEIIYSYVTVIDTGKLGITKTNLYIKFTEINEETKKTIQKFISEQKFRTKYFLIGKYDISITIDFKNNKQQKEIITQIQSLFGKKITTISLNIITAMKFYKNRFIYKKKSNNTYKFNLLNQETIKLKEKEKKILNILQKNPKANILQIAKESQTTPKTAITKINHLKKKDIIKGFGIKINKKTINKESYRTLLRLQNKSQKIKEKITKFLENINAVAYIGELIGNYDMEFDLYVNSQQEFIKLFHTMKKRFKNEIIEYHTLFFDSLE